MPQVVSGSADGGDAANNHGAGQGGNRDQAAYSSNGESVVFGVILCRGDVQSAYMLTIQHNKDTSLENTFEIDDDVTLTIN